VAIIDGSGIETDHGARSADDLLTAARAALAALHQLGLDGVSDDELSQAVMACQELRGALEAAEARVVGEWDRRRTWRASGAKTGAAWLSSKQRLPIAEARRRLRHARLVRRYPTVGEAWAQGEVDRSHLTTLFGVRTARTEEAFDAEHEDLLASARTRGFADFKRHCDTWTFFRDPDGAEQDARDDRDARELHLNQSIGGMWFGRSTFDPVSGAIVAETLRMIEQELFEADWAAAKERLGREPLAIELGRTPAQRRADAEVEMAVRARTAPKDGRRPAPLFTVVVGLETFTGPILELFNRTVITPGTAAGWLAQADVERVVFESPSRVIDVGAQRRFFTGALRRAIEVRDRTCFHPTCDEVPEHPEIDHIHPAGKGGKTTQRNGRLGCGFHNRWRNHHPDHDHPASPDLGDPDAGPDPPHLS
jgi:hypothetical protein